MEACMEEKHVFDNMDIIRRVYDILKKENALTNYTLRIKMSFLKIYLKKIIKE